MVITSPCACSLDDQLFISLVISPLLFSSFPFTIDFVVVSHEYITGSGIFFIGRQKI